MHMAHHYNHVNNRIKFSAFSACQYISSQNNITGMSFNWTEPQSFPGSTPGNHSKTVTTTVTHPCPVLDIHACSICRSLTHFLLMWCHFIISWAYVLQCFLWRPELFLCQHHEALHLVCIGLSSVDVGWRRPAHIAFFILSSEPWLSRRPLAVII